MTLVLLEEITGKFYEATKKIAIQPEKNFDDILKENTEFIGVFSILPKYVIFIPTYSLDTISYILSNDYAKDFIYRLAFFAIANKRDWGKETEGILKTGDENTAIFLLNAIIHFAGGAYLIVGNDGYYYIWSREYHYYAEF